MFCYQWSLRTRKWLSLIEVTGLVLCHFRRRPTSTQEAIVITTKIENLNSLIFFLIIVHLSSISWPTSLPSRLLLSTAQVHSYLFSSIACQTLLPRSFRSSHQESIVIQSGSQHSKPASNWNPYNRARCRIMAAATAMAVNVAAAVVLRKPRYEQVQMIQPLLEKVKHWRRNKSTSRGII